MKYMIAALLLLPAFASAQTTPTQACFIDCLQGYHASSPAGSCPQTCVPDSQTSSGTTYSSYTYPTYTYPSYTYPSSSYSNTPAITTSYIGTATANTGTCVILTNTLKVGSTDGGSGGAVTLLQQFLSQNGYLAVAPTGYFGSLTAQAVTRFQAAQGLEQVGTVGPLTRAVLHNVSCSGSTTGTTNSVAPQITALVPQQGAVGTTVTIQGSGFVNDNAVYFNGAPVARVSSLSGKALTFPIPSSTGANCTSGSVCPQYLQQITPGQYPVYVQNTNGTSNTVYYTVLGGSTVYKLSISNVTKPGTLYHNQDGTWTVFISAPNLTQSGYNLTVSAHWGDEQLVGMSAVGQSSTQNIAPGVASVTFTHSYALPGPYTQTFTVTDPAGQSATYVSTEYVY